MSKGKRKIPADGDGYQIGYGRPPRRGQFRAGQSGNPAGRPKAVRNLMTDVKRTLKVPVKVSEGGRSRRISTQEGALMLLREKALKGDSRALDRLLDLAWRFNNEPGGIGLTNALPAEDRTMLDAYAAEIAAAATASPTTTSPKLMRVKLRRRPRRRPDEDDPNE